MSRPYSTFEQHGSGSMLDGSSNFAFLPGKRRRLNLLAICVNVVLPWLVFVGIYAAMSFSLHYRRPVLSWLVVALGIGLAALLGYMAHLCRLRERDPTWYTFSAAAILFATVVGSVAGDVNYWCNMQPFYDVGNLNTYPSVNPAREKGQQLMDAGRVYFAEGSNLDVSKSMGFKDRDIYCVAPVVFGEETMANYDFWAVGVNCCSGVSSDFRCGDFGNPHARSGLRMMREDQRAYFRLAVQQAEAAYNIKSTHPIFFYWMQDPVGELASYRDRGLTYFMLGVFSHFTFNFFCVICAVLGFSKLD